MIGGAVDSANGVNPSGGSADAVAAAGTPAAVFPDVVVIDTVLAALAEPTRRKLLDLLAARGAATATTLAAEFAVSRQAIVKHLGVLETAGLVSASRAGREVRYVVRPQSLAVTARWMGDIAAEWDRRLARIKRAAEGGA